MFVDPGVYAHSGYSRRVKFEIQLLRQVFDEITLWVPFGVDGLEEYESLAQIRDVGAFRPFLLNFRTYTGIFNNFTLQNQPPDLIYVQNLQVANLIVGLVKASKIPLIFDYHGLVSKEYAMNEVGIKKFIGSNYYNICESRNLIGASLITVVSENFKKYLLNKYSDLQEEKIVVLPMLPGLDFFCPTGQDFPDAAGREVFQKIKNNPGPNFCYIGQNQEWQLSEETLDFYLSVENESNNCLLTILSHDQGEFRKLVLNKGLKNVLLYSAQHKIVPHFLELMDYGFVLRKPCMVNYVASPTKVLEYLSSGVLPIYTESVGDFSVALTAVGVGKQVSYKNLLKGKGRGMEFAKVSEKSREEAKRFASSYVDQYRSNYLDRVYRLASGGTH
ncbi:hypothetical protein DESUT3_17420 [Desulfuromonas versatilis]|uniref:Glycosyltransferase subfamily 4-like N-terminal domain-containing protein n=2 Tax=Desulfuromonas versatilis TaxID=2802975 RepID=A0ABN6DX07_9BACT|nr:hypothetical protein DESUT3_17420 [Desulfuromonas versatilis]